MSSIKFHPLSGPIVLLWAVITVLISAPSHAQSTDIDRIVAIVNDDVITQQELRREVDAIKQQQRLQNLPLPPARLLNEKVLERLIIKHLQQQLADSNGIHVDDTLLNETLHNIARQNKLSLSEFRDALLNDGLNFEHFRDNIRNEMTFRQLRQRHVDSRITVSSHEIERYNSAQRSQGKSDHEYHLGHILISVPEAAAPEQIRQARLQAEEILQQLHDGGDFQTLAIEHSDGQQALKGGDLGWRRGIEVPSLFTEALQTMSNNSSNNKLSPLIRSPSGFHIIKLLEQRGGKRHIITQTQARHILIATDALTSDDDARQQLLALKKELLENGADFSALAKEHSADKGSAALGGELGWVSPGVMLAPFETAMLALKPGQIGAPIQTRYGWHLIQVTDRRQHDDTEDFNRTQVQQRIFQRKADEAYTTWLQRLRADAYVEFRLD